MFHIKPKIPMLGKRFGRLTVIEQSDIVQSGNACWICKCDCGNITKPIVGTSLRCGFTQSCGCLRLERLVASCTTHGKSNTKLHGVWNTMKQRCTNPNNEKYNDYGGRGIVVCEEWRNSFEVFYEWAMSSGYAEGLSIDRIDVNGNYCPDNCRWATALEQRHNRRGCK